MMNWTKFLSLSVLFGLLGLLSCGESGDSSDDLETKEDKQIIAGEIPNAAGKTIVAHVFNVNGWLILGQGEIDNSGKFTIELPNEPFIVQLMIDQSSVPVVLGGNDSIFVRCDFPRMTENYKVSNLAESKDLNELVALLDVFYRTQSPNLDKLQTLTAGPAADAIIKDVLFAKQTIQQKAISFIKEKPSSSVAQIMAFQLFPEMGLENWDKSHGEELKSLLLTYQNEYPEARFTRSLESNLNTWLESYEQSLNAEKRKSFYGNLNPNVEIGNAAPDIWMDRPDGTDMKLSDLRGQYVLIDFWASWCGPCRQENPNVVRLYNKYKDKGFTVFSVSLDDNATNWKAAIDRDQLNWPHHVSDLLKWNSVVVQLYKIQGIPHTVLIDKKGTIIAKNLRGQQLEQKLQELFGF
jgi:thiol-disulfide isomerase/thioredoxin